MLPTYRLSACCSIILVLACFTACSRTKPAARTAPPSAIPLVALELGQKELPDADAAREQLRKGEKIENPDLRHWLIYVAAITNDMELMKMLLKQGPIDQRESQN